VPKVLNASTAHRTRGRRSAVETKIIAIEKITWLDKAVQPREQVRSEVVKRYQEEMDSGAIFPPPIVFWDGESYHLADGAHRIKAIQGLGKTEIEVEVRSGSKREAILCAVGCNAAHGLPRTNADKRQAVTVLLSDTEWKQWSNKVIADRCAVSAPFVGNVRSEIEATQNGSESGSNMRTFMRDGKQVAMNVASIGKSPREGRSPAEAVAAPPPTESEAASAAGAERHAAADAPARVQHEATAVAATTTANDDAETEAPSTQKTSKPPKGNGFDDEKLYQQMVNDPKILKLVRSAVERAEEAIKKAKARAQAKKPANKPPPRGAAGVPPPPPAPSVAAPPKNGAAVAST
jgi:hypothetical protein